MSDIHAPSITASPRQISYALIAAAALVVTAIATNARGPAVTAAPSPELFTPFRDIYRTLNDPCVTMIRKGDSFTIRDRLLNQFKITIAEMTWHDGRAPFYSVATETALAAGQGHIIGSRGLTPYTPSVGPKDPRACTHGLRPLDGLTVELGLD